MDVSYFLNVTKWFVISNLSKPGIGGIELAPSGSDSNIFSLIISLQKKGCEYRFYTEFQSHEPEFDYLKSLEIEEKINKIKWCKRQNSAHFLLSTNGTALHLPSRCLLF